MKRFEFIVTLVGMGTTPEKAWNDATEQFSLDPGPTPDDYDIIGDEYGECDMSEDEADLESTVTALLT